MTHFTRERSDEDWSRGLKVPETVLRNIDEKTRKAISATGGTYNPSAPIVIGGAGLELQCAMQLTNAKAQPGPGKVFRFGAHDYFTHAIAVESYVRDTPVLLMLNNQQLQREARMVIPHAGAYPPAIQTRRPGARLRLPLRLPDGARIAELEIGYAIGQPHPNVPAMLPRARVVRISANGIVQPLPLATSANRDPDGWTMIATPASGTAYYASGGGQTMTLTFNALAGEPVDTSLYGYALEWRDEDGANAFSGSVGNYLFYTRTKIHRSDLRPY